MIGGSGLVNEDNFSKEQIERFELVLLFKQIGIMLRKFYEHEEVNSMIENMIYSQDKILYAGINKFDDEILEKFKSYCKICNRKTFHHNLTNTRECAICGSHKSLY